MVLFLGGCDNSTQSSTSIPTLDQGPTRGGIVVSRVGTDPGNLNRILNNNGTVSEVETYIFQYISQLDPIAMEMRPQLAIAAPSLSADSLQYTYEIKPAAQWMDGKPVMAEDVMFTFKMMMLKEFAIPNYYDYYHSFLLDIVLDPQNPRKFTFQISHPIQDGDATLGGMAIYPRHLWDPDNLLGGVSLSEIIANPKGVAQKAEVAAFGKLLQSEAYQANPALMQGSGAYRLKTYEPGVKIELERVANWWGDQVESDDWFWKAYPDGIIFKPIPDPNAAVADLKAGNLDICLGLPATDFLALSSDTGPIAQQYQFKLQSRMALSLMPFNTRPNASKRPPFFEDVRVRNAMNLLMDRESILETVYEGLAEMLHGPLPASLKEVASPQIKPSAYNIEAAKALLEEAGWVDTDQNGIRDKMINGKKVELKPEILFSDKSATNQKVVSHYKASLAQAGIELKETPIAFTKMSERTVAHDFDMAFTGTTLPPVLPDFKENYFSESWNGGGNVSGIADAKLDSLILSARNQPDRAKRILLIHEIQNRLMELQPVIWVACPMEKIAASRKWNGLTTFSSHPFVMLNLLWKPQTVENQTPSPQ